MDLIVASALLVVLSPLLMLVALLIRIESSGSVLFRQTRIGLGGTQFTVLKFRSMRSDADPEVHREFLENQRTCAAELTYHKVQRDERVTRLGAVIRRLSIDELPQLINVLRREMSLVGPRPDVPYSLEHYEPRHFERFSVLPGLTGLWQVSGRSALSYQEMLELDLQYARTWTFRTDLRLLLRTVPEVFKPERAG
ncbi:MAG: sugar transferase [Actinomycetia bacterium]|nr:sugar transferase [Actinomycetes bacterium]